jgi:hypothetical protein
MWGIKCVALVREVIEWGSGKAPRFIENPEVSDLEQVDFRQA